MPNYTTINKSTDHFNTITYTGSGTSTAYTVGFPTDFVWIKKRDTEAAAHYLFNKISGTEKAVYSNLSNAEETNANSVTSFDANGFTSGSSGGTNQSGHGFVSWNWLAGGTASSNTDGSITSSVSANTTAGFSIVSYTGTGSAATVGHGLGAVPKFMFIKNLSAAESWRIYHQSLGNATSMKLNTSDASFSDSGAFNSTTPTSTLFTVGNSDSTNKSGDSIIAYCFAEKKGFSKFGSYVGNGSSDGVFCFTGFKPAWLIIRKTSAAGSWYMYDNKRPGYNSTQANSDALIADGTDPEFTSNIDLVSNGFKIRTSGIGENHSGESFIYMTFAESPLVGTNNVPCTAR